MSAHTPRDGVAALGRLIAGASAVQGDPAALEGWLRRVTEVFTAGLSVRAVGGLVVPQLGAGAGEERLITFAQNGPLSSAVQASVQEITRGFWNNPQTTARLVDLPSEPHLKLVIVPVSAGFDKPIGYLWALTGRVDQEAAAEALTSTTSLLAMVERAEIAATAVEYLAKPTWVGNATTLRTAREVASACFKAMACAAVAVWEVQDARRTLKTMVVEGPGTEHLSLDMMLGHGLAGACALDNKVVVVDDLLNDAELEEQKLKAPVHPQVARRLGWRSAVFIPLDTGARIAGVLAAYATRPRAFTQMDVQIAMAFAQRLCAGYVHVERLQQLTEMERSISLEAPAIEAGIRAAERVHDANTQLLLAQGQLSNILAWFAHQKRHAVRDFAVSAAQHVDRAHSVIRSLVQRSKVSAPVLTPRFLSDILRPVVDEFALEADTLNIAIHLKCPSDIRLKADKEQLPRVFLNLISNALHFLETDSKPGSKKVEVVAQRLSDDKATVIVRDNGPGIDPSAVPKVFNYFYTTKGERGMGFGLAIAKAIVEAHGGALRVKSNWGYETEFTVTLPTIAD